MSYVDCVFIKINNNQHTIVAVYVDDCFIIGKDKEIESLTTLIPRSTVMGKIGPHKSILTMKLICSPNIIIFFQNFLELSSLYYLESSCKKWW